MNIFNNINPRKGSTKDKKAAVYNNASELYNEYLIFVNEYTTLSDAKKRRLGDKYNSEKLFLEGYDYIIWSENKKESTDKEEPIDVPPMPPLEGDEEDVKEGKRLKILTSKNLLTSLPMLLAQIKSGNNSYKLKNEIRQILYLLYQHNKIIKKFENNLINSL